MREFSVDWSIRGRACLADGPISTASLAAAGLRGATLIESSSIIHKD